MKWVIWIVCCFSLSAFAANGTSNIQQRQQQLEIANSYGQTVVSTMQGLLHGYDVSTLSSAFSQEITNLTNYANSVSSGKQNGDNSPSVGNVTENSRITPSTQLKVETPQVVPPSGSFNITPPSRDGDVSTVPDITGF